MDARDIIPCSLFFILFGMGAAIHMTVFQRNKRRDHKFIFNMPLVVLCTARVIAISMRIAWASQPDNPHLEIAATVFLLLGGVIIIIVNLFFAQRLLRAIEPRLG